MIDMICCRDDLVEATIFGLGVGEYIYIYYRFETLGGICLGRITITIEKVGGGKCTQRDPELRLTAPDYYLMYL